VTVLRPEALDQLGRRRPRLGKLLAEALAERRSERVYLAHRRFAVVFHGVIQPQKTSRVGDALVPRL
jgi:hypothetical protein